MSGSNSLRRNPDYYLLSIGQGVSMLGTGASGIALPLLTFHATHSALWVGVVEAVWAAALAIASFPAGPIVDRCDRRTVLVVCDLARAGVTVPLAVAALTGRPPVWLLLAVGVLLGAGTAPFNAARTACLRQVVPKEKLATAVAVNMARGQAAYLLGPLLGGYLFTLSPSYPFWLDAISFVVSAVSILAIRASLRIDNPDPRSRWWRELTVGLKVLWEQRFLRNAVLVSAAFELVFEGVYLTIIVTRTQQGTSGVVIGAITAAATGGAFVGTLLAGRIRNLLPPGRLLIVTGAACAVLVPVMAFIHNSAGLAALLGSCMMAISLSNIVIATIRIQQTPDHLQGRMNSALSLLAMSTTPLGSALAGVLLDHLPATAAFLVFGALLLALAGALTQLPQQVDRNPTEASAPAQ